MNRHDVAKDPPSRELLSKLIDEYGLDVVMNPKSPTFKKMGLDITKLTKQKALELIAEEPNLLKRPLVLAKGKAIFGFKPDQYDELLG